MVKLGVLDGTMGETINTPYDGPTATMCSQEEVGGRISHRYNAERMRDGWLCLAGDKLLTRGNIRAGCGGGRGVVYSTSKRGVC